MAGSIHWKKDRFAVAFYWEGRTEWFWRYAGEPLWALKTAQKLLGKIQADVDNGIFDPRTFRPDSPLSIAEYSKVWLSASEITDNCRKVYRWAIKHVMAYFGEDHDIRHFTHSKLCLFQKDIPLSEDSKYNILSALKTMLKFYQKDVPTFIMPQFPPLSKPEPEQTALPYLRGTTKRPGGHS